MQFEQLPDICAVSSGWPPPSVLADERQVDVEDLAVALQRAVDQERRVERACDRAGLLARPERLARFAERQDPERGDRGEPRRQRVAEPCRQGVIPRVARAVPEGKDPNHRRMGGDGR